MRTHLNRLALPLVTAAAAFGIAWWRIGVPAFWRDEAVTAEVATRSVPQMLKVLSDIDAVHGLYYVIMHFWISVFGVSEAALRAPSALGAAATAGLTVALGRRLASTRLGVTAGVLVAISPAMMRYGQEARQYTITAALAVLATYLLVRAADRRGWALYALAVVLVGYAHMFALLILPAHLILRRKDWKAWSVAAGAALVAVFPLVALAFSQRYQIDWITPPTGKNVWDLAKTLGYGEILVYAAGALAALAFWKRTEVVPLAAAWLVLPPALLIAASQFSPVYVQRYLIFCIPAAALLIAAGLEVLPWQLAAPLVVAAAMIANPLHPETDRADNLRLLTKIMKKRQQPGDAVVFTDIRYRNITAADPEFFATLDDVLLAERPIDAGDLKGREIPTADFTTTLRKPERVWVIDNHLAFLPGSDAEGAAKFAVLKAEPFRKLGSWDYWGGRVYLYSRVSASPQS